MRTGMLWRRRLEVPAVSKFKREILAFSCDDHIDHVRAELLAAAIRFKRVIVNPKEKELERCGHCGIDMPLHKFLRLSESS